MKAGTAIMTSPGKIKKNKKIIHVAALNIFWVSNEKIIRNCVKNSLKLAENEKYKSIAFPLIGAGTGGVEKGKVQNIILDELSKTRIETFLYII